MLNIVVPMAGRGSRFAQEGYSDPKPLINIHDRRMIEVVINNLRPSQPHKFIFICQKEHLNTYFLEELLHFNAPGCVVIPVDGITEGAACTVLMAEEYIDNEQPLMIANADQWIDIDINDYLSEMNNDYDGLIMTMEASDDKWSYVGLNSEREVIRVVEKKVISTEATVGIYNYRRGADFCRYAHMMIRQDMKSNGEFYVAPVYNHFYACTQAKLGIFNIGDEFHGMYGLGTPNDLERFLKMPLSLQATAFK